MKIYFIPREQALCDFKYLEDSLLVSINDTSDELQEIKSLPIQDSSTLRTYQFLDSEDSFERHQAQRFILDLDYAARNNLDIWIHCYMGVSRSGAFAVFANEYLGLDIDYLNSYKLYNKNVYTMLCREAGMAFDPEDSAFMERMNNRKEVISKLCELSTLVGCHLNHEYPYDCFCGDKEDMIGGFRFDPVILDYIERAVKKQMELDEINM